MLRPHTLTALAATTATAIVGLALAACGGPTSARKPEPASGPDLSPALAPISWITGDWAHPGGEEHWVATAGVLYGVSFATDGSYEVMIIDDADEHAEGKPDGTLRLYAMPGGAAPTLFTGRNDVAARVVFENPTHDDPTSISYATGSPGLIATVTGPNTSLDFGMSPGSSESAPEAEEADLAFARDTDAEHVKGWVRWFADDGAMIRGDQRIEGHDAIRDTMAAFLGRASLLWAPVWSRHSGDGKYAVTVGRARIVEHAAVTWRGSYLTLWRNDPAGWRVVVDVGRGENPL